MASLIENVAVVVVGVFLVVWGSIKGDTVAVATGIGLVGIKGGTYVADKPKS